MRRQMINVKTQEGVKTIPYIPGRAYYGEKLGNGITFWVDVPDKAPSEPVKAPVEAPEPEQAEKTPSERFKELQDLKWANLKQPEREEYKALKKQLNII